MRERANRTLRTRILLDSVAAIEGIDLADGEIDDAVAEMAAEANQDPAALKQALEATGRVQVLAGDILRRKALDKIVASATAIDSEGEHIDLRPPAVADDKEEAGDDAGSSTDEPGDQSQTEEEEE
jgi:trigger factor